MSTFVKHLLTNNKEIQKKAFFHHYISPASLRFVQANQGKPCVVVAPDGMGKTAFAAAYVDKYHAESAVYWLDGSKHQFRQLLTTGDLLTWFKEQIQEAVEGWTPTEQREELLDYRYLVVIDNLPQLGSKQLKALKELVELLIEERWEIIILCTPSRDYFHSPAFPCLKLSAHKYLVDFNFLQPQTTHCIKALFNEGLSEYTYRFVTALLLVEKGTLESLSKIGLTLTEPELANLAKDYPFLGIDLEKQEFKCWPYDFMALSSVYKKFLLVRDPTNDSKKEENEKARRYESFMALVKITSEQKNFKAGANILSLVDESVTKNITPLLGDEIKDAISGAQFAPASLSSSKSFFVDQMPKVQGVAIPGVSSEFAPKSDSADKDAAGPWKRYGVTCLRYIGHQVSDDGKIYGNQGLVDPMYVRLFGGLEIYIGNRYIPDSAWRKNKAKLLFALLVIKQGHQVSRSSLINILWPGMDTASAVNNFYGAWYAIKKLLSDKTGECPYLVKNGSFCWLDKNYAVSDVEEFELISQNMVFARLNEEEAKSCYLRMQDLYRGELYGSDECAVMQAAARHYKNALVDSLLAAANQMIYGRDYVAAIWFARKAHETDSSREDVCRLLMKLLVNAGQRTAAIEVYFSCCQNLDESFGVLPSRVTVDLYESLVMESESDHKSSETLFNEAAERRFFQRQRFGINGDAFQAWE